MSRQNRYHENAQNFTGCPLTFPESVGKWLRRSREGDMIYQFRTENTII